MLYTEQNERMSTYIYIYGCIYTPGSRAAPAAQEDIYIAVDYVCTQVLYWIISVRDTGSIHLSCVCVCVWPA